MSNTPRDLKPCPFCGSEPESELWHGGASTKIMVCCSNREYGDEHGGCSVGPMVTGETPEEAAAAWNRRASPQPQAGEPIEKPYAYEFGRSNGDDTYSVFIERSLPAKPHPDWPVTSLYAAPQPANPAQVVMKLAHDPRCSVHKGQPCDFDCARDYPQRDALIAKLKAFVTAKEWWGEQAETLCRWAYEALERDAAAIGAGGQAVAMTVIDPDEWEPCSPSYLTRGGSCSAPRVWNEAEGNHWHPKLPSHSAGQVVDARIIAEIIDPHSFMDIPFTDDPVLLDMVEQSKQDAIRKAERILSALSQPHPADERVVEALDGIALIAAERRRQIEGEGWSLERDDAYRDGELARAGGIYAVIAGADPTDFRNAKDGYSLTDFLQSIVVNYWPWDKSWLKITSRQRALEKAGACIAAEIDRLLRLSAKEGR